MSQKPSQSFPRLHSHLGVSGLASHAGYIWSTGRDGTLRRYQLNHTGPNILSYLGADKLPMEWGARVLVGPHGVLVLGFLEHLCVLWDPIQSRLVLQVECGGGHRSWDYHVDLSFQLTLVFIKDKQVHLSHHDLEQLVRLPLKGPTTRLRVPDTWDLLQGCMLAGRAPQQGIELRAASTRPVFAASIWE
ncbi:unnamed protein product [Timema podura]|uniref:Uncharacterized protein n=1 Tax=Timema podura TaxID=61482 RepID=A0ABN7PN28_TIMPD|nr:unnamed protein product [Timema podura]